MQHFVGRIFPLAALFVCVSCGGDDTSASNAADSAAPSEKATGTGDSLGDTAGTPTAPLGDTAGPVPNAPDDTAGTSTAPLEDTAGTSTGVPGDTSSTGTDAPGDTAGTATDSPGDTAGTAVDGTDTDTAETDGSLGSDSGTEVAQPIVPNNPILKWGDPGFLYAADPAAEVFDGKVYVYCSHDQPDAVSYKTMQDYVVLESADLQHWINHGVVLEPRTFSWADGQMNAPDAAYKDGWYYWYFPYNKTYIGVVKSRTPVGPWEEAVTDAITTIFDPTVFVDDDGQAYIYGNDGKVNIGDPGSHIMGAKLKDNMIELDGEWHRLSAERVSEAVTVFKRNGIYYFMARLGWDETGYWMADNPLPYPGNPDSPTPPVYNDPETGYASYKGLITQQGANSTNAPSHMSAIEFGGKWWFFYHRGDVNNGSSVRRSACFDEMHFNADGTIQPIVFTLGEQGGAADPSGVVDPSIPGFGIFSRLVDVGAPVPAGASYFEGGVYAVEGSGVDIEGTADQCALLALDKQGDGAITAQVYAVEPTDGWAKGGIMFRQSEAADAANVALVVRPDNMVALQYRPVDGGDIVTTGAIGTTAANKWIRLVREGSTFTGSYSTDGVTWTTAGQVTVDMASTVLVGLVVSSHQAGTPCRTTFDHVTVE